MTEAMKAFIYCYSKMRKKEKHRKEKPRQETVESLFKNLKKNEFPNKTRTDSRSN